MTLLNVTVVPVDSFFLVLPVHNGVGCRSPSEIEEVDISANFPSRPISSPTMCSRAGLCGGRAGLCGVRAGLCGVRAKLCGVQAGLCGVRGVDVSDPGRWLRSVIGVSLSAD